MVRRHPCRPGLGHVQRLMEPRCRSWKSPEWWSFPPQEWLPPFPRALDRHSRPPRRRRGRRRRPRAANLSARGGLRRRRRPRARRNLHRERGGAGAEVDPSRLAPGELIETVLQGDADVPPRHLRRSPKVKASDEHAFAEFSRRLPGVNLRRGTEKPGFIRTGSRWEERGSGRVEDENRMHERAARGEGDQKTRDRSGRATPRRGGRVFVRAGCIAHLQSERLRWGLILARGSTTRRFLRATAPFVRHRLEKEDGDSPWGRPVIFARGGRRGGRAAVAPVGLGLSVSCRGCSNPFRRTRSPEPR